MVALIKKDFFIHPWLGYGGFLLIIAFLTITTLPVIFTTTICLLALAYSLFSYDHMKRVNIFLKSLPISANQIVVSRYLYGLLLLAVILMLQWIFQSIFAYVLDDYQIVYYFKDYYVFFVLFCFTIGLCYPILYFFKNMYMAAAIIALLILVGTYYTIDILVKELQLTLPILFNDIDTGFTLLIERVFPYAPYLTLTCICGIFLFISIKCSITIYNRKTY